MHLPIYWEISSADLLYGIGGTQTGDGDIKQLVGRHFYDRRLISDRKSADDKKVLYNEKVSRVV